MTKGQFEKGKVIAHQIAQIEELIKVTKRISPIKISVGGTTFESVAFSEKIKQLLSGYANGKLAMLEKEFENL